MLERRGIISGYEGSKPRQVLITEADVPRILSHLAEAESGGSGGSSGSGTSARPAPEAAEPVDEPRTDGDEPGPPEAFEG